MPAHELVAKQTTIAACEKDFIFFSVAAGMAVARECRGDMQASRHIRPSRTRLDPHGPERRGIRSTGVDSCGEFDEEASPLGAKGMGELTAVSVAPAIANAVYHATGKRVRDLPITVEKIL